jgi:hypothetical protein
MLQNCEYKCKTCELTKFTFAYVHTYVLTMYLIA